LNLKNENGTLTDLSSEAESNMSVQNSDDVEALGIDAENSCILNADATEPADEISRQDERAEYERLIRTRFKEFYTDDTQKMINKRFKRYKAMEQRLSELEANAEAMRQREAELDLQLESERERVERETERRVVSAMLASQRRPMENGYSPRRAPAPFDVTRLTKSQRADIAKRASGGEKISF
jgi:hypothetical protein